MTDPPAEFLGRRTRTRRILAPWYRRWIDQDRHRIDKYKSRIDELQSRIDEYQSRVDKYQSQVDKYQSPIDGYQGPIDGYRSPINKYRSLVNGFRSRINKHRNQIDEFRSQIYKSQSSIKRYQSQIEKYLDPFDESQSPVDESQSSIDEPQSPTDEPQSPIDELKPVKRFDWNCPKCVDALVETLDTSALNPKQINDRDEDPEGGSSRQNTFQSISTDSGYGSESPKLRRKHYQDEGRVIVRAPKYIIPQRDDQDYGDDQPGTTTPASSQIPTSGYDDFSPCGKTRRYDDGVRPHKMIEAAAALGNRPVHDGKTNVGGGHHNQGSLPAGEMNPASHDSAQATPSDRSEEVTRRPPNYESHQLLEDHGNDNDHRQFDHMEARSPLRQERRTGADPSSLDSEQDHTTFPQAERGANQSHARKPHPAYLNYADPIKYLNFEEFDTFSHGCLIVLQMLSLKPEATANWTHPSWIRRMNLAMQHHVRESCGGPYHPFWDACRSEAAAVMCL